ncbi:MAG: sugar phosphate isomerase/epimerase family protein [Chthoniobacterales bacterium]
MTPLPNRRDFLKRAALLAAATALPASRAAAAFEPIPRIAGANLKTSVNAYSFFELLMANAKDPGTGIDLFGVCDFCAKQGSDAVDLTGYFFSGYPKAPDDKYLIKLKRHAFDCGLAISGTGVRNDFTAADKAIRKQGVRLIKTWIEVAAKLGAPTIRAFADSQPPFKNWHEASGNADRKTVEARVADALRECADYAKKFGVIVAVQNHGDFISTGEQHLSLLKLVDSEWCAALVDTGRYISDDPYADIAMAAPYAVNWQIKETLGSSTDSPRTDVKRLVRIIRKSGYRGYVPIETLSMERKDYDSYAEVTKLLAEVREAIESTA